MRVRGTEAFDTYRGVFGPTHDRTLVAMHVKADALAAFGRQTESDRLHQDLIATFERLPEARADILAATLRDYGRHMVEAGKPARAVELCRRALAIQRKTREATDRRVITTRQVLAEALHAQQQSQAAAKEGREILAALESGGDETLLDAATARYVLAKYLLAVGGLEEARGLLRDSIRQIEQATGRGSRQALMAIHLLAITHVATDELAEAVDGEIRGHERR